VTQPDYVPLAGGDRVRPVDRLPVPQAWLTDRPAELDELLPVGTRFGAPGPDLGYGLKLAKRFEDRLVVPPGEHAVDAIAGGFACGTRRAAHFGRAPVIYDMEWAYLLWGYLGAAPEALIAFRAPLFKGASHDYGAQRRIVDLVRPEALPLTPAQVTEQLGSWPTLITAPGQ
jgi:hypothetical protein